MPLPLNDTAWPPKQLSNISPKLHEWGSWYAGDTDALAKIYGASSTGYQIRDSVSKRRGFRGALQRWFWGAPTAYGQRPAKLHVPIASDIATASADLLFAEEVGILTPGVDKTARDRLDLILQNNSWSSFLPEGAEVCAGLGGAYWRVTWDTDVADEPLLSWIHADSAVPTFRYGRLVGVTFWEVLHATDTRVLRRLERHEKGVVLHGLYEGTPDNLGRAVPLAEHPATEGIDVDENGAVVTEYDGLTAGYVPNIRPSRAWMTDPVGKELGRADIDGVEPLMDALDETYSSWQRDVRLGKARLNVPQYMLENLGPGQGGAYDVDAELYSPLNMPPGEASLAQSISQTQFAIRYAEHAATARDLLQNIIRSSGYSAQTFGYADEVAATATEVNARERKSLTTREKKTRYWGPELVRIIEAVTGIDAAQFSGSGVIRPDIEFPPGSMPSPIELGTAAQMLRAAQAASTATLVRMVHPDWDQEAVDAETALVVAENGLTDLGPLPGDPVTDPADPFAPDPEQAL